MMKLNKVGVVVLEASEEFEKYEACKLGLRDVFKLRHNYLNSMYKKYNTVINDIPCKVIEKQEPAEELENPTNEEIEQYIRAREEYVADAILKECGWEDFVKRCKAVNIENYITKHMACEGPEGQCNMFCPKYFDCFEKIE